jgi:hypothetical protein
MKLALEVKYLLDGFLGFFFPSHLKVHLRHHYLVHGKLGEFPHNIKFDNFFKYPKIHLNYFLNITNIPYLD